jgi:hypothetical protein
VVNEEAIFFLFVSIARDSLTIAGKVALLRICAAQVLIEVLQRTKLHIIWKGAVGSRRDLRNFESSVPDCHLSGMTCHWSYVDDTSTRVLFRSRLQKWQQSGSEPERTEMTVGHQ